MRQLKFWTVLTVLWLCTFFTIERLHEPMNIASFVYVITAILSVIVLVLPRLTGQIQFGLFGISLGLLILLKSALEYPIFGAALPITVTEALALGITIFVVGRIHRSVQEFQHAALKIAGASNLGHASEFHDRQAEIYRELRLARNYQRPLALMTITPQLEGSERLMEGFVEEIYRKSARQYVHGQVAELLVRATDGCATVIGRDDHLVISLPEVDAKRAEEVLSNIRSVVRGQLGIELVAGTATFPEDELTLRGLIDRAEAVMRDKDPGAAPTIADHPEPVVVGESGS
jgi:hypothetical protein